MTFSALLSELQEKTLKKGNIKAIKLEKEDKFLKGKGKVLEIMLMM